jgi:hypothetical protein
MTQKEAIEFTLARNASEDFGGKILHLSQQATPEAKELLDEAIAKFSQAGYVLKLIVQKHRQHGDVKRALHAWEARRSSLRRAGIELSD